MQTSTEYQGFYNFPTWLLDNFIFNDQVAHDVWTQEANDAIQEAVREQPDAESHTKQATNQLAATLEEVWRDNLEFPDSIETYPLLMSGMMNWALDQVDWREIAEHLVTVAIEGQIAAMERGAVEP